MFSKIDQLFSYFRAKFLALMPSSNISDKHKFLGLDHLRAFAIIYVFLFHYKMFGHPVLVDRIGNFGWTGVDLFFVLSGFLISGQLFEKIVKGKGFSVREFFMKRFFRIIPPYLVVLGLYITFPFLREREGLASIWRYLTFTLNFGLDLRNTGTFTHAWSLCVEEQFYLIFPLIMLFFNHSRHRKYSVYLLLTLFLSGFFVRYLNWQHFLAPDLSSDNFGVLFNKVIYYPTYNRLDSLLCGISIAGLYTFYPHIKERVNKYCNLLMLIGITIVISSYFICTPQHTFNTAIFGYPTIALGYGIIVAAAVCPNNILYNFKSSLTANIATLSYAIYLIHKLAIHFSQNLLVKTGMDRNGNFMMLCCICITISGALLLRYAIEKPSIRLRNKMLRLHNAQYLP